MCRNALRPGGSLAIAGRFDAHWHPLRDHGHVKFFSIATLGRLLSEQGFEVTDTVRVGRLPPLARSMIMRGVRNPPDPGTR